MIIKNGHIHTSLMNDESFIIHNSSLTNLHTRKIIHIGMRQKKCGCEFVHELIIAAEINIRHAV